MTSSLFLSPQLVRLFKYLKIYRKCFFSIFLIISLVNVNAQNVEYDKSKLFQRFHYNFELSTGFSKGRTELLSGPLNVESRTLPVYRGNFSLTIPVVSQLGIKTGVGYGVLFSGYNVSELTGFINSPLNAFLGFYSSHVHLQYQINPHKNWVKGISLGFESFYTSRSIYGLSISTPQSIASYSFFTDQGWKPFIHTGVSLTKPLKGLNLLRFNLSYQFGLKDFYRGNYFILAEGFDNSQGVISTRANQLTLSAGYSFTGARKSIEKANKKIDNSLILENLPKKRRWDTDSSRTKVSVNVGLAQQRTRVNDPANKLYEPFWPQSFYFLTLEHFINPKTFIETGFGIMEYYSPLSQQDALYFNRSSIYVDAQLIVGMGRSFYLPKLKRSILNLSGGFYFGFNDGVKEKSYFLADSFPFASQNDYFIDQRKVGYLFYLAASKDFWLSPTVALNLSYRMVRGLRRVAREQYVFLYGQPDEIRTVTTDQLGSFNGLSLGVKVDLGRMKAPKNLDLSEKGEFSASAYLGSLGMRERFNGDFLNPSENYTYTESYPAAMLGIQLRYQLMASGALEADLTHSAVNGGFYSESFRLNQLSTGYQYQLKTGLGNRIATFHAGFGAGLVSNRNGSEFENENKNTFNGQIGYTQASYNPEQLSGKYFYTETLNGDTIFTERTVYSFIRSVFTFAYIGISKDIKLYKNLYTGFTFRKQLGLVPFFTTETNRNNTSLERTKLMGNANNLLVFVSYRFRK